MDKGDDVAAAAILETDDPEDQFAPHSQPLLHHASQSPLDENSQEPGDEAAVPKRPPNRNVFYTILAENLENTALKLVLAAYSCYVYAMFTGFTESDSSRVTSQIMVKNANKSDEDIAEEGMEIILHETIDTWCTRKVAVMGHSGPPRIKMSYSALGMTGIRETNHTSTPAVHLKSMQEIVNEMIVSYEQYSLTKERVKATGVTIGKEEIGGETALHSC